MGIHKQFFNQLSLKWENIKPVIIEMGIHDITEILLKVALSTKNQSINQSYMYAEI
jgi:hypothetical protein